MNIYSNYMYKCIHDWRAPEVSEVHAYENIVKYSNDHHLQAHNPAREVSVLPQDPWSDPARRKEEASEGETVDGLSC